MRIAVASDDGVHVAAHTGRCDGFVIYEVAASTSTRLQYRENRFTAHAKSECDGAKAPEAQEHHHSHAPLLHALRDCCALVTRGLGPRLIADLVAAGVLPFVCSEVEADAAARMYAAGELPRAEARCGCCSHG